MEEEERIELEESSFDRNFLANSGDNGFNIVPEFDSPIILLENELLKTTVSSVAENPETSMNAVVEGEKKRFYILYHSLKLDCC